MQSIWAFLRRRALYLLLAAILLLDLAYLTRSYYWDGVLFSLNIEGVHRGALPFTVLFHPNHLLYSALGYVLYSAVSDVWPSSAGYNRLTDFQCSFERLRELSHVFLDEAAHCLIFHCHRFVRCSSHSARSGGNFRPMRTATFFASCCCFSSIDSWFKIQHACVAAAACHTMAMLFHELSVFMYVPVLAVIALDSRRSRTTRFWSSGAYLAGTGSAVAIAYLLCYSQVDHRVYPNLMAWITSYASDSGFTHSIGQIVGAYLSSYLKLFVGGKLSFIRDYFSIPVCCFSTVLSGRSDLGGRAIHPDSECGNLAVGPMGSAFSLAMASDLCDFPWSLGSGEYVPQAFCLAGDCAATGR